MRKYILVWPWHSMLTGGVVYSSCFKSAELAGKNVACLFVRLCQVVLNTVFALPTEISQWAVMQHYYYFVQFSCYPVQFENFLHLKPAAYFLFLSQMPLSHWLALPYTTTALSCLICNLRNGQSPCYFFHISFHCGSQLKRPVRELSTECI